MNVLPLQHGDVLLGKYGSVPKASFLSLLLPGKRSTVTGKIMKDMIKHLIDLLTMVSGAGDVKKLKSTSTT
ncbi:MAG: hypothetical protein C4554_11230 [Dethiobacter sp.]|nr:MAG: hypothetical protein C4554_11230 [Dethiobacter sp.]